MFAPAFAHGFPPAPDLIPDSLHSASASDSDRMDNDMDFDMDDTSDAGAAREPTIVDPQYQYSYSEGGSGGFGFGPGADEDELSSDDGKGVPSLYPSLTPHPNPHHFSNAATGAWAAQTTAAAAAAAPRTSWMTRAGLIQPTPAMPLGPDATAVDHARNQHGPGCTSIPKLRMSDYPDPATGTRSLWAVCQDCGAVERAG